MTAPPHCQTSRRHSALLALGGLAFSALGYWLTTVAGEGRHSVAFDLATAWLCIVLGAMGTLAMLLKALMPSSLWIDGQGFTVKHPLTRPKHYRWTDIDRIRVTGSKYGTGYVAWNSRTSSGGVWKRLLGSDGSLTSGWTLPPLHLASDMEEAKNRRLLA